MRIARRLRIRITSGQNRGELATFLKSDRIRVFLVDETTGELYASIYVKLRRIGKQIPTNDVMIAATAIQHGMAVFTFDEHFTPIAG